MSDHKMPGWALPALSWLVSFYFLFGFALNVGFPPQRKLFMGDGLYVFLWLFFLFLPFFSKIKIGKLIELEREIHKANEELRDFKTEIRNSVSVLTTNVNTLGNITNQVTINIPALSELQQARRSVNANTPEKAREEAQQVEQDLFLESEDTTMALARTRIEIEKLLRKILGKSTSIRNHRNHIRFIGPSQLFENFVKENEDYSYLLKPFRYVTQICNAAIHAQRVPDAQAQEALALGAQIIAVLREVSEGQ